MTPAGWIMSLEACDMDDDGDLDVLITDRYGEFSGCRWLERQEGEQLLQPWPSHRVGPSCTPMFLTRGDIDQDGWEDVLVAVKRGAIERLIPILMTALAAGLALVPLALSTGEPGSEIQAPMAVVILFGLLSSTVLNMIVVPALYLRFGSISHRATQGVRPA